MPLPVKTSVGNQTISIRLFPDTICVSICVPWYPPVADQARCIRCSAVLLKDEIALTRKLVNRGADKFYCLRCLADHYGLSEDILRQKIAYFKAMGCTLFK